MKIKLSKFETKDYLRTYIDVISLFQAALEDNNDVIMKCFKESIEAMQDATFFLAYKDKEIEHKKITINEFLECNKSFINKGWIAFDEIYGWQWFENKPNFKGRWFLKEGEICNLYPFFDIEVYQGFSKDSLIEIG